MQEIEPPVNVEPPATPAPAAVPPPRHSSWKPVVVLGLLVLLVVGVGAGYWIATAEERLRRRATDALHVLAELQEHMVFSSKLQLVQLENGTWAKVQYRTQPSLWHIDPTDNDDFPYKGTIITPYERFATIFHETREAAEQDEILYRLPDEEFYGDRETATAIARKNFYYTPKLEVTVLYDRKLDKWLENTQGVPGAAEALEAAK